MSVLQAKDYLIPIDESWEVLDQFINQGEYSKLLVIVDENTLQHCYPIFKLNIKAEHFLIEIKSGESQKVIEVCEQIWNKMIEFDTDRKSLVINLGGGVIGDMGGFCASTYMRGIDFIQIPTTLLSQVDASVGGKLGIDYKGLKNMIGVFNNPKMVWVQTSFLSTLPKAELRSGYAELIKHALIADYKMWTELKTIELLEKVNNWGELVTRSIAIKNKVVLSDPFEGGQRKILNFGHTYGHAIESLLLDSATPLLHGEAIAHGMIMESEIAVELGLLATEDLKEIRHYLEMHYGVFNWSSLDDKDIKRMILKDKKNIGGQIRLSLVDKIGHCTYDVVYEPK